MLNGSPDHTHEIGIVTGGEGAGCDHRGRAPSPGCSSPSGSPVQAAARGRRGGRRRRPWQASIIRRWPTRGESECIIAQAPPASTKAGAFANAVGRFHLEAPPSDQTAAAGAGFLEEAGDLVGLVAWWKAAMREWNSLARPSMIAMSSAAITMGVDADIALRTAGECFELEVAARAIILLTGGIFAPFLGIILRGDEGGAKQGSSPATVGRAAGLAEMALGFSPQTIFSSAQRIREFHALHGRRGYSLSTTERPGEHAVRSRAGSGASSAAARESTGRKSRPAD